MRNLLNYELRSRLGAIAGWSFSLALFGVLYLSIYPELRDQLFSLGDTSLWKAMKFEVGTFEGFVASVVVQLIPVYLGIYVIITSTDTLAGEEDRGITLFNLRGPLCDVDDPRCATTGKRTNLDLRTLRGLRFRLSWNNKNRCLRTQRGEVSRVTGLAPAS